MTGTVTDPSGAVIVGAQVAARNDDTGVETSTRSNERGIYLVPNLPPGDYSLQITKGGFKPVEFLHVHLILDQVAALNATLSPGTAVEAITVTSGAPVLETETSTVGTNMNGDVVTDLPLNVYGGRQAEYFAVALTPGYSPLSDPYLAVINGNQGFTKEFTIDGTSGTAQIQGNIFETGPSMEAIEELQAETSGLSARNGNTNGGVIMLNLKSGTNQFHGSVFGYGHNELLDANTFDNNHLSVRKGKSRFWDWGFSAGGPIIKNKTFIFGTFERYTQNDFTPGSFGATVPTLAFLQGDFSGLLGAQLCTDGNTAPCTAPATPMTVTNDAGQTVPLLQGTLFDPATGNAFTGNMIPSNMFSSVSQKIIAIYQKSYAPELARDRNNNRMPASNSPSQTPNEIVIKVDHNLRDSDKLSGSWVYNHRPRTLIDSGGVWAAGSTDGGPLASARFQMVKANEFRVSESHTFTPTLLNVFNATYNWYWNGSIPTIGTNFPQQLGFGNTGASNFPAIDYGPQAWNGLSETAIGNSWQGHYVGATFIYGDQLTWTKGQHTFSFGGDFRAMQLNSQAGSGALTMHFQPQATADPSGTSATGFGFADFLLGRVASASQTTPFNLYGRRKALSFYAQDDFKATRKLTLNLGLRWDINFRLHEKNGNWANFDLNAIDPNLGIKGALVYAKNGSDSFEKNQSFKNFGPQFGFAYNPWEKVVFRGSVGMLYVPIGIQYWQGVPYAFDPGARGTNAAPGAFNWDSGYPGVFTPGTKSSTTPSPYLFPVVTVNPDTLKAGYSETLNLGVQYELTKTSRIEASYIGNRGHRLIGSNLAYNEADPKTFMNLYNSGNFWANVCNPAEAASAGVPYPYPGFCGPSQAAIAPYPQLAIGMDWYMYYPNLYYVGLNKGQSFYDSMVLHYVKRAGHGLVADVSYTLSRQEWNTYTNFTDSYDVGLGSIQDYGNLKEAAHTLSPYDQKHVIKAGIQYELPFGHGHDMLGGAGRVLNAIVSGWKISPLLTYATGKPLSFYANDQIYGPYYPAWSAIYVNYNLSGYNGRMFDPSKYVFGSQSAPENRYFPASIASDPALGQLGTGKARIDQLRGFGTDREDLALHKSFKVGERYSLDFGVEFYNVLNRHAFADPDTSSPNSTTFGMVTGTAGSPRNGQFEARFRW
ncbi:MAG TPA: carboxypeptidase regulatory-like domain-containing protein [Terriglobales bacterium]